MKKAIIFDLDNTIYPVHSIGNLLFSSLFQLMDSYKSQLKNIEDIKEDIMRKPFQMVAAQHHFNEELTSKGIDLLKNLTYTGPIFPYSDYSEIQNILIEKFLVTTGFLKLQMSKIKGLGIEKDFMEILVVDPMTSDKTKKDVFSGIMERQSYSPADLLVVGDDPDSEIKAANALGIETVLYNKLNLHSTKTATYKIVDFKELIGLL